MNPYDLVGDVLQKQRLLDRAQPPVRFLASNVRWERTGVHASLQVQIADRPIGFNTCNVERIEERVKLANAAFKQFGQPLREVYPEHLFKADLDDFCLHLWDGWLSHNMPEQMGGSKERTPPRFLIEPFVIEGGGTALFGPPGRGKSYLMMLMAVCLDAGCDVLWPVHQTRTLIINLERSKRSVMDRLGNVNAVLGLPRGRQIAIYNARGKSLLEVSAAAQRYVQEHGIGCVFVDSISRAGGGDLNANDAANRIVDSLNRIAPTWLGLCHTPRGDESHLFGSIHFEAGADVIVQLVSEARERALGVGLQIVKNNDVGQRAQWTRALEFDERGLVGLRVARAQEFVAIERRRANVKDIILDYLMDNGAASAWDVSEELGLNRSVVARTLSGDPQVFERGGMVGHKRLYRARAPGAANGVHR